MDAYRDSLVMGGSGYPHGEGQSQSGRVVRHTEERQADGVGEIKCPDQGWGWVVWKQMSSKVEGVDLWRPTSS